MVSLPSAVHRCGNLTLLLHGGEVDQEDTSGARRVRCYLDGAAGAMGDAPDDGKTEAAAGLGGGGEALEGFPHPGALLAGMGELAQSGKMTPPIYQDMATTYTAFFTECDEYVKAGG